MRKQYVSILFVQICFLPNTQFLTFIWQSGVEANVEADEVYVGGYGAEDITSSEPRRYHPQTSSLIEEDEGGDAMPVIVPEVEDAAEEVFQSSGADVVMKQDGLGHMVGVNDVLKREAIPVPLTQAVSV
jgi:hypothetical protein